MIVRATVAGSTLNGKVIVGLGVVPAEAALVDFVGRKSRTDDDAEATDASPDERVGSPGGVIDTGADAVGKFFE